MRCDSAEATMTLNLDREQIYIRCPRCNFWAQPFLRQIRHRETIICGGCKSNIHLDDHLGSFRKAQRQVTAALEALESSLRNITINIKL